MKKPILQRAGDFMAGKGFYIVLFLCVAAIGISGYYLLSGIGGSDPQVMVTGTAEVVVPTTPPPVQTPTPSPSAGVSPARPVVPSPAPTSDAIETTPVPSPSPSPSPDSGTAPVATQTALVFTWPVKGLLDRDFSLEALAYDETMNDWRTHSGIDISAELGTQVFSAASGTVTALYKDDLMGTTLSIDHGGGLLSTYANLAATPAVEIGDVVNTGDVIGAVGATAIAESIRPSHLHFEISKDGEAVDPMNYLPELP